MWIQHYADTALCAWQCGLPAPAQHIWYVGFIETLDAICSANAWLGWQMALQLMVLR
jgi:hypothetical protein